MMPHGQPGDAARQSLDPFKPKTRDSTHCKNCKLAKAKCEPLYYNFQEGEKCKRCQEKSLPCSERKKQPSRPRTARTEASANEQLPWPVPSPNPTLEPAPLHFLDDLVSPSSLRTDRASKYDGYNLGERPFAPFTSPQQGFAAAGNYGYPHAAPQSDFYQHPAAAFGATSLRSRDLLQTEIDCVNGYGEFYHYIESRQAALLRAHPDDDHDHDAGDELERVLHYARNQAGNSLAQACERASRVLGYKDIEPSDPLRSSQRRAIIGGLPRFLHPHRTLPESWSTPKGNVAASIWRLMECAREEEFVLHQELGQFGPASRLYLELSKHQDPDIGTSGAQLERFREIYERRSKALIEVCREQNAFTSHKRGSLFTDQQLDQMFSENLLMAMDSFGWAMQCYPLDRRPECAVFDVIGRNILHLVCEHPHFDFSNHFDECPHAVLEAKDNYGMRPAHIAALNCSTHALQKLIELGADLVAVDNFDRTPLYLASQHGQVQTVELLLKAKCPAQEKDCRRPQPLFAAAKAGHVEIVVQLLIAGADTRTCYGGKTAQQQAKIGGHHSVCQLLGRWDGGHGQDAAHTQASLVEQPRDLLGQHSQSQHVDETATSLGALRRPHASGTRLPVPPCPSTTSRLENAVVKQQRSYVYENNMNASNCPSWDLPSATINEAATINPQAISHSVSNPLRSHTHDRARAHQQYVKDRSMGSQGDDDDAEDFLENIADQDYHSIPGYDTMDDI